MPTPNDNQAILTILERFNGLPSLKTLQAQLNLEREDAPISRRDWKEATRGLLAADPVITASIGGNVQALFGEEQSFKVIYCRLSSTDLRMTDERVVVAELQGQYPYALFVFSDQAQKRFHFLNVKDEPDGQKRRLFRRITVGNGERLRTAAEQLAKLDGETLKHFSLSGIQARFDEAFDVGPVTKKFFAEYKSIFEIVRAGVQGFPAGETGDEARNLFTQRLFNRLMFLAFIQKKGWLQYGGNTDYLCTLWTAHRRDAFVNKGSFYEGRLKPLFFLGLNTGPSEVDLVGINRGGSLQDLIGDVPYLNGGLFEKNADDDNPRITVPDAGLDAVINDLFERFNFTITESTPLDIEVAVDPEMLGKIFEELVTGRHESGSYYTPKPIVSFMCREALKGYLETQVANESKEAIARFVDRHEPDDIHDAEGVLNALRRITVCDPACGSGAYLLGMLHELLDLRESLFKTKKLDHEKVYDRKLEIIQNNLYGVDIAEFAVNIARLRLWLSLSVDFGGAKPEPLPNLDYKIEVGDSVCSPSPGALQMGMQQPLVDQLLIAKSKYLRSHGEEKRQEKQIISRLRRDICVFSGRSVSGFDSVIDFAEVFVKGGFDVTIANPPYVRMERFKDSKAALKRLFPAVHSDRADLYCYFYARAMEMLASKGTLAFISSDKWLKAKYGKPLRTYLSATSSINTIVDFGDLPVFENADAYPMILIATKGGDAANTRYLDVRSLGAPYPDVQAMVNQSSVVLQQANVAGGEWLLNRTAPAPGSLPVVSLLDFIEGKLYYGIKTGLNAAFFIDDQQRAELLKQDRRSERVIKPALLGRDIRRWDAKGNRWLLFMPRGVDVHDLNPILQHLQQWKGQLESRATKQMWYELQQSQERYAITFDNPKIVFPDIADRPRFALDYSGSYIGNTAYAIGSDDPFLLGVLNSKSVERLYRDMSAQVRGGYLRFIYQYVSQIPIPLASPEDRTTVASLVERLRTALVTERVALEEELDLRVAMLFRGLI